MDDTMTDIATTEKNTSTDIMHSDVGMSPEGFNMEAAWRTAKAIASGKLFGQSNPNELLTIMMTGHELGLSPTASVRAIHVINGRACLSADAMVAIVLKSGLCEFFNLTDLTDTSCTYSTKRKGTPGPVSYTFTMDDAKKAGLTGGNWSKWPKNMLRARCASNLVRTAYPDALLGIYAIEDMEGVQGFSTEPQRSTARDLDAEIMGEPVDAEFEVAQ